MHKHLNVLFVFADDEFNYPSGCRSMRSLDWHIYSPNTDQIWLKGPGYNSICFRSVSNEMSRRRLTPGKKNNIPPPGAEFCRPVPVDIRRISGGSRLLLRSDIIPVAVVFFRNTSETFGRYQ